jgi:hypothetical protein
LDKESPCNRIEGEVNGGRIVNTHALEQVFYKGFYGREAKLGWLGLLFGL